MRITKVKILSEVVQIAWQTPYKDGGFNQASLESKNDPAEAFAKAVNDLKPFLISICEIEALDKKLIKATGITIKYKGENDIRNVIITGIKTYKNSNGCMTFNTSPKADRSEGEPTAEENLLPEKCVAVIDRVIDEAKKFIKGERLQIDMDEVK